MQHVAQPTSLQGMNVSRIAACWVAHHDQTFTSPLALSLIRSTIANAQEDELLDTWQRLGAFRSIRAFGQRKSALELEDSTRHSQLVLQGEAVFWEDPALSQRAFLGTIETLFQRVHPQEAQVKLAYDTFRFRFLAWLERSYQVVALEKQGLVFLFTPEGNAAPDLALAWQDFISYAFSISELQRTFVLLVNSTTLSERGFSIPDIPIVTLEQADILIALFYATLQAIAQRLQRLERERSVLLPTDKQQQAPSSKKDEATLAKLEERLTNQHILYDHALNRLEEIFTRLRQKDMSHFKRIQKLSTHFTLTATRQFMQRQDITEKAVDRIEELLSSPRLSSPPPLLTRILPLEVIRKAGDFTKGFCYACGGALPTPQRGEKKIKYTANKLIMQSPSQTLQTHFQQVQPEVCPTCALLAMACPLKMISGLIISLSDHNQRRDTGYVYEHHLRMLTTGELNIVAGRFLMLPCIEQAPDTSPLIDHMGGKEYALLKIASIFPSNVLSRFTIEVFFGADPLLLQKRHLIALRFLIEMFGIQIGALRDKTSRPRYIALSDAIRSLEHDQLIFALYRLLLGFQQQSSFSLIQCTQLEAGLVAYKEQLLMDSEIKIEQRFADIAGLTGILFAFISFSRSKLSQNPSVDAKQRDRELKKLLEKVDNPNHFTYEAAGTITGPMTTTGTPTGSGNTAGSAAGDTTGAEAASGASSIIKSSAQLWRGQHNYFIYDEAKRLLQEAAQVNLQDRETRSEKGDLVLKFYYDDICKVYAALYQQRYSTEKAQRDLTYELKLSLYSRFPELRPGNQN